MHIAGLFLLAVVFGHRSISGIVLSDRKLFTSVETASGLQNLEISAGHNVSHIEVHLSYPTVGWLAMGLSPTGGMDRSDVLFAYVNDTNGQVVVQDRYLTANMDTMSIKLTMDAQQDWTAISGSKNRTHTTIRAVRKLITCDPLDRPFTEVAGPVIYSFNNRLPVSPNGPIAKHTFRGQTEINFLKVEEPQPDISKEIVRTLEFRMPNQTVTPDKDTHYYCKLTQLPRFEKKYQSIASQPVVNSKNMKHIHHMLLYVCTNLPANLAAVEIFDCSPSSNSFLMKYCQGLIGGWAMGAKPIRYMPNDVGQPFTPQMSGSQVVLQIHYNNPEREVFTDDSGMRFLLTDKLRKYDAGNIVAGVLSLDWTLTIPPGLQNFHVQGQCSDQCTSQLPADGINIFASAVHMHTRGKSQIARHFRGAQEILPPLAAEMHYDFNFQQSKPLETYRKFLPGDRVVVECNFTSAGDTEPIYGGEGSMEEMCMVFLSYYPKIETLNMCGSKFSPLPYLDAVGLDAHIRARLGHFEAVAGLSGNLANQNAAKSALTAPITAFIKAQKWNPITAKPLEDFYSQRHYVGLCFGKDNVTVVQQDNPPEMSVYRDPLLESAGCH